MERLNYSNAFLPNGLCLCYQRFLLSPTSITNNQVVRVCYNLICLKMSIRYDGHKMERNLCGIYTEQMKAIQ